jgi:hypothetical protein
MFSMRSVLRLYNGDTSRVESQSGGSEGSQGRQRVKYGHESRGARNQDSLCWRGSAAIYHSVESQSEAGDRNRWFESSEDTADQEDVV